MLVYADRYWMSNPGLWYPEGAPVGLIPHNGFFVYKGHDSQEPQNIRCHRVIYTDNDSQPAEGYVYEGYNLFSTDQEYEEIWEAKSDFMNYKCNTLNTSLIAATAENILGVKCTVYTLSALTYVFSSPDGYYLETIPAGTQIGIAGNNCGNSRPYLLYVQRIYRISTNQWSIFNKFIDLRFDLGNMPNTRLLR